MACLGHNRGVFFLVVKGLSVGAMTGFWGEDNVVAEDKMFYSIRSGHVPG